jgi:hypothetical protein
VTAPPFRKDAFRLAWLRKWEARPILGRHVPPSLARSKAGTPPCAGAERTAPSSQRAGTGFLCARRKRVRLGSAPRLASTQIDLTVGPKVTKR